MPQYLYFADVDNDGDQDALWGVKSHWEVASPSGLEAGRGGATTGCAAAST